MSDGLALDDIQGIVASAYTHLPYAAYVLLRINRDGALGTRRWLRGLAERVTTASAKGLTTSLNIALTHSGLERLGLAQRNLETFSLPFKDGMASARRISILGDVGGLEWGSPANGVDILVMLYARTKAALDTLETRTVAAATAAGTTPVTTTLDGEIHRDSCEHFGFVDGIGQPVPRSLSRKRSRVVADRDVVRDGEFVLGYENEYGYRAEAPYLGADGKLGRNGSYLVFRQTAQYVPGFWSFVESLAAETAFTADEIAAKIVGRWKSGAPLVRAPFADDAALSSENDFGFAEDPDGFRCPLGAHIRRANPRDGSLHTQSPSANAVSRRHRLLRRGRSYGPRYVVGNSAAADRGLHFIALCADLERQFEFVQQTWLANPALNDLDEVDPLVGAQRNDATFTIQQAPVRRRLFGMQTFVTLRGGAYFFLPSIAALRWLGASGG